MYYRSILLLASVLVPDGNVHLYYSSREPHIGTAVSWAMAFRASSSQVRSDQVRSGQARPGQVWSGQAADAVEASVFMAGPPFLPQASP